jgi:hypothetical protein
MTKGQIGKVRAMLAKAGITDEKEKKEFVMMITGGRTDSLTACNYKETKSIIAYLETTTSQRPTFKDAMAQAAERQRRYIMAMAHQMHWHRPGTRKVDMGRIDNWCIQYSGLAKPLDEIDDACLPSLVTQFKKVLESFLIGF